MRALPKVQLHTGQLLQVRFWPFGFASIKWTVELSPYCPLLELDRANIANVSMSALTVVETFDVVEHIRSRVVSGTVVTSFDALSFERSKKAFDHRVVTAASRGTHAAGDGVCPE